MNVPDHDVYADASEGPFLCGTCKYFNAPTTCTHPEIVKLRKGIVEFYACCDYFKRNPAVVSTAKLLKKAMTPQDR